MYFLHCTIFFQATERFEAIYPTLKEVALAGSPGSKAMKQVSQQIFSFVAKAAGESMILVFNLLSFCISRKPLCRRS